MTGRMWALLVAVGVGAAPAAAAQGKLHPRWEIPGFDFRPDGAFRKWARRVAAYRAALLARGNFRALNAPPVPGAGPAASPQAVAGTVHIPAVLFQFAGGTLPVLNRDTSDYTTVLFGATPPGSNPYTERTFYEQMSNGLLSLQGNALGFITLDSAENHYAGKPGTCSGNPYGGSSCNGLFSGPAQISMQAGLQEALQKLEATMHPDWSVYDYDASTGELNLVIFVQPAEDGACGPAASNHLWSHRWALSTPYTTKTPWPGHAGHFLTIENYTLQSGVGGTSACDPGTIMAIGTATHETGHAFGLPDLYDVSQQTEGAGEWSLMGSGNYTAPYSPSRMDSWSLSQLGWVTVVPITTGGTYAFGPAPTSDTAFLVRARGANPRGEYYLLENRQAALADTAMIRIHCAESYFPSAPPPSCGGGLLVWHVDSEQVAICNFPVNCVNAAGIHGVELEQADGLANLDATPNTSQSNRGDAGDPYPGLSGNTRFGTGTNPAAIKNIGGFAGFTLDSIAQLVPGGAMSFVLRFGTFTTVTSNDPAGAVVTLDDTLSGHTIQSLLDSGSTHLVSVADTQVRADSLVRYVFQSWSDGLARSHSITIAGSNDSLSATLAFSFRVAAQSDTGGTLTATPGLLTGAYFGPATPVSVVAHAHAGQFFLGWSGDTTAADTTLALTLVKPYSVRANFSGPLPVAAVVQVVTGAASPLTAAQRQYLDLFGNKNGLQGDVGDFLAWVRATHPTPPGSAPVALRAPTPVAGARP